MMEVCNGMKKVIKVDTSQICIWWHSSTYPQYFYTYLITAVDIVGYYKGIISQCTRLKLQVNSYMVHHKHDRQICLTWLHICTALNKHGDSNHVTFVQVYYGWW